MFQQLLKFVNIQHLTPAPPLSVVSGGVDFHGDSLPLMPLLCKIKFPWGPSEMRSCVLPGSQFTKCLSIYPLY